MDDIDSVAILLCGICENRLKNPRYLVCLHSFCEECLESWISKTASQDDNGIKCKICNTFTAVCAEGNSYSEDWVGKLPRNNFVASLVEREKIISSGEQVVFCRPCSDEDGTRVKGSHWCQQCSEVLCANCANFHKKVKHLASHKVYSLNDVKEHPEIITKAYELCEIHPEEKLETYCYSHEEPSCVRCLVSKHRHCEDTIPIDQWVRETQNAQEPAELLQELERKSQENTAEKLNVLKYLEINDKITNMRNEIDNHLNKLEKQLRSEVSMFMNTLKEEGGKEVLNFSKIYLKNLIKSGTTVQLLTSMKKIRTVLADTNKKERRDEMLYVQFDEHLENFKEKVKSFGHIVSEERTTAKNFTIALNVPLVQECTKRPPIDLQQVDEHDNDKTTLESKRRKDQTDIVKPKPKARTKVERTNDDLKTTQNVEPKGTDSPLKSYGTQPVGLVDNIAEIERKLKIFIDKHITLVTDGNQSSKEIQENGMDIDVYKDKGKRTAKERERSTNDEPARYAKVKKDRKRDKKLNDNANSIELNKHEGQSKIKNDIRKAEPMDPEKEKLNALINNYLKKAEKNENENSLSKTKSFYFSTPDIPSAIFENQKLETVFDRAESATDITRQKMRRNSLQAASTDEIQPDDPDYDEIDYDAPFFKPSYMPIPDIQGTSTPKDPSDTVATVETFTSSTEDMNSKHKESDDVFDRSSVKSASNKDFQIYSPQSQVNPVGAMEKSLKIAQKGKSVQKKRFFEKAREKLKRHKKNGKFDVEQSTKDMIFYEDPMNDPIYVGTPYEIPVKWAAHELPTIKSKKESPYEENFQIIHPPRKNEGIPKEEADTLKLETTPIGQINDEYVTIIETEEDIIRRKQHNNHEKEPEKDNCTKEKKQNEHNTRRPSVPKATIGGVSPSFLSELRQKLEVKKPEQNSDDDNTHYYLDLESKDKDSSSNIPPNKIKTSPNFGVSIFPSTPNTLKVDRTNDKPEKEDEMINYELKKLNDFNVQSGDTFITGGVFNRKDKLLLIDSNEQKLYTFTCSAECQDVLYFKDKPWDIANVNENIIAITFPEAEAIDLVDIAEMKIFKRLPVRERCYGVDYQDKNLVIRCAESIKIMNLHGTVIQSIKVNLGLYGYVACHDDKIYYTNKSSLICIDKTGEKIFYFENEALEGTEGIGVDFDGNVFVAGLLSNNVWQISGSDGKQHRQVVPSLMSPKLIVFSESLNRFFLTYDLTNIIIYDVYSSYGSSV